LSSGEIGEGLTTKTRSGTRQGNREKNFGATGKLVIRGRELGPSLNEKGRKNEVKRLKFKNRGEEKEPIKVLDSHRQQGPEGILGDTRTKSKNQ